MKDSSKKPMYFSWQETSELLLKATEEYPLIVDAKRKSFIAQNEEGEIIYQFSPPLIQPIEENSSNVEEYLQNIPESQGQLLVLIQAGAAALGVFLNGTVTVHKAISKYMVRGKGKAQTTYLKTKGKSRYGSRLRLQNSLRFFDEIHGKFAQWSEEIQKCQQFFYSCPVRLWSEVFSSQSKPVITREDSRWHKVPLYVNKPKFKELKHIFYLLSHGTISKEKLNEKQ